MKRLYFRPAGPSQRALLGLAALALGLLVLVEQLPVRSERDGYAAKVLAARKTADAFSAIHAERVRRGLRVSPELDPADTGMIGGAATLVTTSTGNLAGKQTTANPNLAALVVEYLLRLEVQQGSLVAVGYSGSFPALNAATLAAIEALELEPVIIASATASDYGASDPELMWLDMEKLLLDRGVFRHRSVAASLGGIEDQGIGLSDAARALVLQGIAASGATLIDEKTFEGSLEKRMEIYDQAARGRPFAAYVNIGGGSVSVGRSRGKSFYKPGINRPGPSAPVDSIIGRFLSRGVPVVNLTKIDTLARAHQLPIAPKKAQVVGQGEIFGHTEPNRPLAAASLVVLGAAIAFVKRRSLARAKALKPSAPAPQ